MCVLPSANEMLVQCAMMVALEYTLIYGGGSSCMLCQRKGVCVNGTEGKCRGVRSEGGLGGWRKSFVSTHRVRLAIDGSQMVVTLALRLPF